METELMKISHIKYLETKITLLKKQINSSEQIYEKFKPKYQELVLSNKLFYKINNFRFIYNSLITIIFWQLILQKLKKLYVKFQKIIFFYLMTLRLNACENMKMKIHGFIQ